jgi:hypothetical protein
MKSKSENIMALLAVLLLALVAPGILKAQTTGPTLSGTITQTSGATVVNAKVSVKNLASGQTTDTQTDSAGRYSVANLPPGDYEISVSAQGYSTNTNKVTISAGVNKTADMTLAGALSLGDLGFTSAQTQGSAQDQARLDKRSHMLRIHQRLGLITTAPLIATVAAGFAAGGKSTSSTSRDVHAGLGSLTAGLYISTAYFSIFAPKVPGTHTRGSIRAHKILALIHGPGMVLTPVLGAIAFDQKSRGEKIHGIASAHGAVAIVTAAAYGAAILSVSVKF